MSGLNSKHWHRDKNGFGNFGQLGGSENEHDFRRRFFQGFEQCVERGFRQHVNFVDDVHLVAAGRRAVLNVIDQVAHFADAVVGRAVDFHDVDADAVANFYTEIALVAGFRRRALFAIECLGEQAGGGGFTDAAGAGKQVGVGHAVHPDGVVEGADDVLLSDQLRKLLGPPFAGRDLKVHILQEVAGDKIKGRIAGYLTAPEGTCYRCFLPDLTGFTRPRCVRPNKTAISYSEDDCISPARPDQAANRRLLPGGGVG